MPHDIFTFNTRWTLQLLNTWVGNLDSFDLNTGNFTKEVVAQHFPRPLRERSGEFRFDYLGFLTAEFFFRVVSAQKFRPSCNISFPPED